MTIPPSDESRWFTPGVRCLICGGYGTELVWAAEIKAYACKDVTLCSVTVLLEGDLSA